MHSHAVFERELVSDIVESRVYAIMLPDCPQAFVYLCKVCERW